MKKTCIFLAIFGVLCMGVYRQTDDENPSSGIRQTIELGTIYYSGNTSPIGYRCNVCELHKNDRVFMPYRRGAEYDALQHIVDVHAGKVEALGDGHYPSIYFRYGKGMTTPVSSLANWQIGAIIYRHKSLSHENGYRCDLCNETQLPSGSKSIYAKGTFEDALKHILQAHGGKTEAIFSKNFDQWTKASQIYFRYVQKIPN